MPSVREQDEDSSICMSVPMCVSRTSSLCDELCLCFCLYFCFYLYFHPSLFVSPCGCTVLLLLLYIVLFVRVHVLCKKRVKLSDELWNG